jgi:prophage regulatory protein
VATIKIRPIRLSWHRIAMDMPEERVALSGRSPGFLDFCPTTRWAEIPILPTRTSYVRSERKGKMERTIAEAAPAGTNTPAERILRRREVLGLVGISQSSLYAWMATGDFPRPVALGRRLVGWRSSDVEEWIASREPRVTRVEDPS